MFKYLGKSFIIKGIITAEEYNQLPLKILKVDISRPKVSKKKKYYPIELPKVFKLSDYNLKPIKNQENQYFGLYIADLRILPVDIWRNSDSNIKSDSHQSKLVFNEYYVADDNLKDSYQCRSCKRYTKVGFISYFYV